MESQGKRLSEMTKETALSNDLLTKWLINLEERLRKVESLQSPHVTWGVSQAELTETKKRKHGVMFYG